MYLIARSFHQGEQVKSLNFRLSMLEKDKKGDERWKIKQRWKEESNIVSIARWFSEDL